MHPVLQAPALGFSPWPLVGAVLVLVVLFVLVVGGLAAVGFALKGRGKKVAKQKKEVLDDPYNSPIVDLVESIRVRKTHERGKELLEEMADKMYPGLQGKPNAGPEAKP